MTHNIPSQALQLRSLLKADGTLEISLQDVPVPEPRDQEVLIRIEATPINPSDLGMLFAMADPASVAVTGTLQRPQVTARVPERFLKALAGRIGQSMAVGNEGAGTVVAAGAAAEAQALLGRTVAVIGGAMYAQYRVMKAADCLLLHEGTTAVEGASCFVNPLTALGMVETMRLEGHKALVHTAAASNLGQMLLRICLKDGIPLINVVRRQEHVDLLKSMGASHVCNSTAPGFLDDLTRACRETGATLGFDATGGGPLAGQLLACMEAAAVQNSTEYSRYGSTVHKQVYIYGGLDRSPTTFTRNFGASWGMGGWLLFPFLQRVGPAVTQSLRQRVADEIRTTFASHYSHEVSLAGALRGDAIADYIRQATGAKFLIRPHQA